MLLLSVVEFFGRGHELAFKSDLVVMFGSVVLIEFYPDHFGERLSELRGGGFVMLMAIFMLGC